MKKLRAVLMLICSLLIISSSFFAFASPISDEQFISAYSYKPYVIKAYDVNIDVSEDNVLTVTENISAYFNQERHGIIRTIPRSFTISRADGTSTYVKAKISHVKVSDDYSTSLSSDDYTLQIGDEDYTVIGDNDYKISYQYDMGRDNLQDADELYYNIIGTQWDTAINNVTFTINMPKEFDASSLGFSSGSYGTVGTNNILYNVDKSTITGSFENVLAPNEGLTVRLELPDGYFTYNVWKYIAKAAIVTLPALAVFIIVLILWILYGRDKHVVETVEFYPPEGMNSAQMGLWYRGNAKKEDIISLLVYLADKGYISLEESDSRYNSSYTITKIKDYDGNVESERIFMEGLFSNGKTSVTEDDLEHKFYTYIDDILSQLNSKESKSLVFSKKSLDMKSLSIILTILGLICSLLFLTFQIGFMYTMPVMIAVAILFGIIFTVKATKRVPIALFIIILMLVGGGVPLTSLVMGIDIFSVVALAVTIVLSAISAIICKYMTQRTNDGYQMLGKIRGFKTFLDKAEKDKLEALVEENPTYFYNILPYAYVLGVSDKWIKKFENIAIPQPEWYVCPGGMPYNYIMFSHFMSRTMATAATTMTTPPPQQNSDGSFAGGGGFSGGGGGFSGGGGGGGGGSSW